ncbi:MAG TPA: SEC-C metal-binding domain-containing protein [Actinocrinis sp.]|nr:SEC-C metal-binding domain-containing protein [Actinocrinis sp.]
MPKTPASASGAAQAGIDVLAELLRSGEDDPEAERILENAGLPSALLTDPDFGPEGRFDQRCRAGALAALTDLRRQDISPAILGSILDRLVDPYIVDLVADQIEAEAARRVPDSTAWFAHVDALRAAAKGVPAAEAAAALLQARVHEGRGETDEARRQTEQALALAPDLFPAIRDRAEYELCSGNWARAWQLASSIEDDDLASNLLWCLDTLRKPAQVPRAARPARNQPCPCRSGRKYKACCEGKDTGTAEHHLERRAPALYAMLATYSQRSARRALYDRLRAQVPGSPATFMFCLDLAIFDGGAAAAFMACRGHLLREDERALLDRWLTTPLDLYEVTWTKPGSRLRLRSLVGGPQSIELDDRAFSSSVGRLDLVLARLQPENLDGKLRALGGLAWLDRGKRRSTVKLFPTSPLAPAPGNVEGGGFTQRAFELIDAPAGPLELTTTDGDEVRFCTVVLDLDDADAVWEALLDQCEPAPEQRIRTADDYRALHTRMPEKFLWNTGEEIESIVKLDTGGFINVGTLALDDLAGLIKVSTNSEQRLDALIELVRAQAPDARVFSRQTQTAQELAGPQKHEGRATARDRLVRRRLGLEFAEPAPRRIIYESYFLPVDFEDSGLADRISRVTMTGNMLAAASIDGMTPAQALAAGGEPRLEALALIDDCEWSRRRKAENGEDVTAMPDPDELRQALGVPR